MRHRKRPMLRTTHHHRRIREVMMMIGERNRDRRRAEEAQDKSREIVESPRVLISLLASHRSQASNDSRKRFNGVMETTMMMNDRSDRTETQTSN